MLQSPCDHAGIIENAPTGSQTDNNYNSIVNFYIGNPNLAAARLILGRLAGLTAGSGSSIVFNNGCINYFYLTRLSDKVMLSSLVTRSRSVRFSSHLIVGGEEVMGQDIIGQYAVFETRCGQRP